MIGIIDNLYIFEFRNEQELLYALNSFTIMCGYESCALLDPKSYASAIIVDKIYQKYPTNLNSDTKYTLYMNKKNIYNVLNEKSQSVGTEETHTFVYNTYPIPTKIT